MVRVLSVGGIYVWCNILGCISVWRYSVVWVYFSVGVLAVGSVMGYLWVGFIWFCRVVVF